MALAVAVVAHGQALLSSHLLQWRDPCFAAAREEKPHWSRVVRIEPGTQRPNQGTGRTLCFSGEPPASAQLATESRIEAGLAALKQAGSDPTSQGTDACPRNSGSSNTTGSNNRNRKNNSSSGSGSGACSAWPGAAVEPPASVAKPLLRRGSRRKAASKQGCPH
jgi:hypothetical protein